MRKEVEVNHMDGRYCSFPALESPGSRHTLEELAPSTLQTSTMLPRHSLAQQLHRHVAMDLVCPYCHKPCLQAARQPILLCPRLKAPQLPEEVGLALEASVAQVGAEALRRKDMLSII